MTVQHRIFESSSKSWEARFALKPPHSRARLAEEVNQHLRSRVGWDGHVGSRRSARS